MKRWMTEKFNLEGKLEEMRLKTKDSHFYSKQHLTGKSDIKIRKELDRLDKLEDDEAAVRGYRKILNRYNE